MSDTTLQDNAEAVAKIVVGVCQTVFAIIVAIGNTLLASFIFVDLWRWFVMPVFHLPPLTLAQSVGVNIIIAWATLGTYLAIIQAKGETDKMPIAHAIARTAFYLLVWGISALWNIWFVHGS